MGKPQIALLLALASAGTALTAQTTHMISGGGSALQAGLNAAVAGDTLIVQTGVYTAVTCTEGVHIQLQPGAQVIQMPLSGTAALTFSGIAANETAVVTGGELDRISMLNCAGTVVADGVTFNAYPTGGSSVINSCTGPVVFVDSHTGAPGAIVRGLLHITDSAQVSFTRCTVPYVSVTSSNVTATDTACRTEGFGQEGMLINSGRVTWQGGVIQGTYNWHWPVFTEALHIIGGEFVATGGCAIESDWWFPTVTTSAIEAHGGTVRLDPSVHVSGTPPIIGTGTVITAPIPSLSTTHNGLAMTVGVASQPGNAVFTLAGLPRAPYTTPWGSAWILPTDPLLDGSLVGPSGTITFAYNFPSVPWHFVLTLQPVALDGNGTLTIGAPQRFAWN